MSAPRTPPTRFAAAVAALPHETHVERPASQSAAGAAYKQQPALFQQFKNARIAAAAGELHGRFSSSLLSLSQFDQFHKEKDRAVSAEEQARHAQELEAAREEAQNRRLERSVLKPRVGEGAPPLFANTLQPQSHASSQRDSAGTSLVASPVASPQRSRPAPAALALDPSHTIPASAQPLVMQQPLSYAIQLSSAGTAILQHPPIVHEEQKQQQLEQPWQSQQQQLQPQQRQADMAGLQWLQTRDERVLEQRQLEADAQSRAAAAAAAAVAARVFGHSSASSAANPASHVDVVTHTRSRVRNLRSAMDSLGLDESTKRASGLQQASPEIASRSQPSMHLSKPIAMRRSPLEPRSPSSPAAAHSASQAAPVASARRPVSAAKRAAERKAKDLPEHVARLLQIQSAHARRRANADSSDDSSDDGEAKAIRSVRRASLPAAKSSVRVPASPSRAPALAIRSFQAFSKPSLSDEVADAELPLPRPRSSMAAARVPINQLAARAAQADDDDDLDSTSATQLASRWAMPVPYVTTTAVDSYEQLPRPSLAAPVQPLPSSPIHVHIHPQPVQPLQSAQSIMTMPMQPMSQPMSSIPSRASSPPESNASSRLASRRSSVVSSSNFAALPAAPNQPQSSASWGDDPLAADDAAADAELSELGALLSADGEPGFDASLHSLAHAPLSATSAFASSAQPASFSYTAPLYTSKPASSFSGASNVIVPVARRPTQSQQYMEFLRRQQGEQQQNGATSTRSVPAHSFFQPNNDASDAHAASINAPLVRYAPAPQPQSHAFQNGTDLAVELNPSARSVESAASLRSNPASPAASAARSPSSHGLHPDHVNHLADTSLMSPARLAAYLRHYLAHRTSREEGGQSRHDAAHAKLHLTDQDESQLQRVLVELDSIRSAQDFGSDQGAHVMTTSMAAAHSAGMAAGHGVALPPKSPVKNRVKPLPQLLTPQRKQEQDIAARIAATHRRATARARKLAAAEDARLAMALLHIAADKAAEGTFKKAHAKQMQKDYSNVRTPLDSGRVKAPPTNRAAATRAAAGSATSANSKPAAAPLR